MPRHCTVCAHPERPAIDHALIAGDAAQRISDRYCSLSRPAIQRHKAEHLPQTMVKAKESEDVGHAIDVVKQLKAINGASLQILNEAGLAGNSELVLKAVCCNTTARHDGRHRGLCLPPRPDHGGVVGERGADGVGRVRDIVLERARLEDVVSLSPAGTMCE